MSGIIQERRWRRNVKEGVQPEVTEKQVLEARLAFNGARLRGTGSRISRNAREMLALATKGRERKLRFIRGLQNTPDAT